MRCTTAINAVNKQGINIAKNSKTGGRDQLQCYQVGGGQKNFNRHK